jgi:hypothetical protein
MAALQYVDQPGYAAILFRRTYADLALPGALMDRARGWLHKGARWNQQEKTWTFPSGATLSFGYLDHADDKYRYQSSEFQFIGFDELTQFGEAEYTYLFSRLRRLASSEIPLRVRAASNPGGAGHDWVRNRFLIDPKNRVFVSAKLADNPHLDQVEYREALGVLDDTTKRQLLDGDWNANDDGLLSYDLILSCEEPTALWPDGKAIQGTRPDLYLGVDVGRTKDRSVIWTWEKVGDVYWAREIYVMQGASFREQKDAVKSRLTRNVIKCQIDKGGIGYQLAEELEREHRGIVEGVQLTTGRQGQIANFLKIAFLENKVRIPVSPDIRDDFRLVRKVDERNGLPVIQTNRGDTGHADRFWAAALGFETAREEHAKPPAARPRFITRRFS